MKITTLLEIHGIGKKLLDIDNIIMATKNMNRHNELRKILLECRVELAESMISIYENDNQDINLTSKEMMEELKQQPFLPGAYPIYPSGVSLSDCEEKDTFKEEIDKLTNKVNEMEASMKQETVKEPCKCEGVNYKEFEKQMITELTNRGIFDKKETKKAPVKRKTTRK